MKRNQIIDISSRDKLIEHKQCIAFHEAGHATAIYLNNKARNLPPIFFQIMIKDLNGKSEKDLMAYLSTHDNYVARVEGGRLIEILPFEALVHKTID